MSVAKLKINKILGKKRPKIGEIIKIEVDVNNIPLDRFWRNRVKDSAIDNCVELIPNNKKLKLNNVTN